MQNGGRFCLNCGVCYSCKGAKKVVAKDGKVVCTRCIESYNKKLSLIQK